MEKIVQRGRTLRPAECMRLVLSGALLLAATASRATALEASADHPDCLYAAGETGVVTFTAKDAKGEPLRSGVVKVRVDNYGDRVITNVTADLAVANPFRIAVSRREPGFVRFTSDKFAYGIGFDVRNIRTATPLPDDFLDFWRNAIAKYDRKVPADVEERVDETLSTTNWIVERVSFAAPGGRRVYGYLTKERGAKGRLPGRVNVAAAGYGGWSQNPERYPGMVTLKLTVYDFEPGMNPANREKCRELDAAAMAKWGAKRYCAGGISESREAYFYYPVILACNRAVDWFASRADVDSAKIHYWGTSQGGGLGLAMMALNRHFSHGCVFVPALTDLLGFRVEGRQSGWPQLVESQREDGKVAAERNAPYFCGVNFARQIRIPIRFVVGYADQTCSPNAVYSGFNACASADKDIVGGIGMGHNVYGEFYERGGNWTRNPGPGF